MCEAVKGKREDLYLGDQGLEEKAKKGLTEGKEVWLHALGANNIPIAIVLATTISREARGKVETASFTQTVQQEGRPVSVLLIRLRMITLV